MRLEDISVPEVYTDSWDFRFFLKWIWECLAKIKYDTDHIFDNYDPLKCKEELLWMLGDTIGYKYDDRLPAAFNRLVLLYFMQMIRKKGSKDGVTFAAEVNLAQFNIISYGAGYEDEDGTVHPGNDILYNRLEDTSVPVNAVYVTHDVGAGYIDVTYFSTERPVDACIEYVRPLGMYVFQHAGVRFDSKTQVSIDARLTQISDRFESIGSTRVGHYTRDDYARMQRVDDFPADFEKNEDSLHVYTDDERKTVYYSNIAYEEAHGIDYHINPGYRALYSLQLCNNEHLVKALIDPHFSLGYGPQTDDKLYASDGYYIVEDGVKVVNPKSYLLPSYAETPPYNLRYDRYQELSETTDVSTYDEVNGISTITNSRPMINPIYGQLGDAIERHDRMHTYVNEEGKIKERYDSDDYRPE